MGMRCSSTWVSTDSTGLPMLFRPGTPVVFAAALAFPAASAEDQGFPTTKVNRDVVGSRPGATGRETRFGGR